MKKDFKVNFIDKIEIRMGSPYNHCKVKFKGFKLPEMEEGGYQDLLSWSGDFKYLALVKWNINSRNEPGFNIYVADTDEEKIVFCSKRIEGICKAIKFINNDIKYTIIRNGDEIEQIEKKNE